MLERLRHRLRGLKAMRRILRERLQDHLLERGRQVGAVVTRWYRLLLEVREDNAGAIEFYDRAGFVEIDRRERYYRDGATGIVLALELASD